jgi:hypothetical protein
MTAHARLIAVLFLVWCIPAKAGEEYDGVMKLDQLACIHPDDAENLIHFIPTDKFPTFRSFLLGMQETERCVWWRKGDKLIVSSSWNYYGAEHVVAARRPPDQKYLFVDKCGVEGAPCP